MRRWRVVALMAAVAFTMSAVVASAQAPTPSKITEVVAYEDRALVAREAALNLNAGVSEVVIGDLPPWVQDDSLRAGGSGAVQVTILGLEVETVYLTEARDERLRALQKEIDVLKRRLQAIGEARGILDAQIEVATRADLTPPTAEEQIPPIKFDQWGAAIEFVGRQVTALRAKGRGLDKEERTVKRELEAKTALLREVEEVGVQAAKRVKVAIEAAGAGAFTLRLSYVVPRASWRPTYDVRADVEKKAVALTYLGTVTQTTGEDWKEVSLALSTARPAVGAHLPELEPWYLQAYVPLPAEEPVGAPARAERPKSEGEELAEEAPSEAPTAPATAAVAEVEHKGTFALFRIARPETVPSDGNPHRTTIAEVTLTGDLKYVTIPKLAPYAYLNAHLKNTTTMQLLGGAANVFVEGNFVGATAFETAAPQQEFDLSLGIDEGIKVERKIVRDKTTLSRVRDRYEVRNTVRITVENYKRVAQTVTVMDQVPVSQDTRIKVKLINASPKAEVNEEKGELTWRLDVKPGEKQTVEFEFLFSFPEDWLSVMKAAYRDAVAF